MRQTRSLRLITAVLAAATLLAGCRKDATSPAAATTPAPQQIVDIAGSHFTLNGSLSRPEIS